jgi:hypothetical protein
MIPLKKWHHRQVMERANIRLMNLIFHYPRFKPLAFRQQAIQDFELYLPSLELIGHQSKLFNCKKTALRILHWRAQPRPDLWYLTRYSTAPSFPIQLSRTNRGFRIKHMSSRISATLILLMQAKGMRMPVQGQEMSGCALRRPAYPKATEAVPTLWVSRLNIDPSI